MTRGAKLDLLIRQGVTFFRSFRARQPNGLPVDLTGCLTRGFVRKSHHSAEFFSLNAVIVNATGGEWSLNLSAAETANIRFVRGVYDVEIEFPNGLVRELIYGNVLIAPEVTRDN